jgi:hypothetical protein
MLNDINDEITDEKLHEIIAELNMHYNLDVFDLLNKKTFDKEYACYENMLNEYTKTIVGIMMYDFRFFVDNIGLFMSTTKNVNNFYANIAKIIVNYKNKKDKLEIIVEYFDQIIRRLDYYENLNVTALICIEEIQNI